MAEPDKTADHDDRDEKVDEDRDWPTVSGEWVEVIKGEPQPDIEIG